MVSRGPPPLPWRTLPDRRHTNRLARRSAGIRETAETEAEAYHERTRREDREGVGGSQVCGVLSTDAEGLEERLRRGTIVLTIPRPPFAY